MLGEDEASYFFCGKEFSEGVFKVFEKVGTINKPVVLPVFIPLIYSFFFMIFGPSLGISKIISVIFGILTILVVYLIGKKTDIWYGIFSSSLLLSIPLFTHFMFLAYVDVPIAFFSALITYLILKSNNLKEAILLGILLGISYHTKTIGLFLIFMTFIFSLVSYKRSKKRMKLYLVSVSIALLLIGPIIVKNIIYYNYPFFEGLNYFFKNPTMTTEHLMNMWGTNEIPSGINTKLSPNILSINFYFNTFGLPLFFFMIFGFSLFCCDRKLSFLSFLLSFIVIFLLLFNLTYIGNVRIVENRYLFVIFPQMSLLGGFFLWKLKEKNNYFLLLIILLITFSVYISITVAQGTINSQRYPEDYIKALEWIKNNTPKDSVIFTPYGGSVKYFAERDNLWGKYVTNFNHMMKNPNSEEINSIFKKIGIDYILIWRGILAEDVIIPESNIMGAMTYKFSNVVINDKKHFEIVYQNQNNIVLKVL